MSAAASEQEDPPGSCVLWKRLFGSSGENQPRPRSSCVCGAPAPCCLLPLLEIRLGLGCLTLNQRPAFLQPADLVFCRCHFLGCVLRPLLPRRAVFVPGNRPLAPLLFPACSSRKQPVGSSPACRDPGLGVGRDALQSSAVLCASARGSAAAAAFVLFAGWGYVRTWGLHCIGSSAVRHRDDKQPDDPTGFLQEYWHCKHAGPAVTQARFASLICCSWERWVCFSAVEGECDDSVCLLRLHLIFSESFCSAASLNG